MKKLLPSLLFLLLIVAPFFAKAGLSDSLVVTTHVYATKAGEALAFDLYRPYGPIHSPRLTVLYVHGGGFAGGRRDSEDIVRFSRRLASQGFCVASISYRLTMRGKSFSCDQPAPNKIRTFQLAVEDIRDATLLLLQNSSDWGIDTEAIVLAGSSAGAEAVLHAAFWGDADLLPSASALPAAFRYGGLISMAGAIVDTSLITRRNAIPVQLFHGTCDPLVPYATAPHHYCQPGDPGYLILHGAQSIAARLDHLAECYYFLTECNAGHEWAGLPLEREVEAILDFLYRDVINGENRRIHRWYYKEGSCEQGVAPAICRED